MANCFGRARPFCGCFSPPSAVDGVRNTQITKDDGETSQPQSVSVSGPVAGQQIVCHQAADAHKSGRLAITFSGGGFLLPYFIGVAEVLRQLGVLRLGGASSNPAADSVPSPNITFGLPPDPLPGPSSTSQPNSSPDPGLGHYGATPLAGSSAGSLIAVSLACGLTPARILDSFLDSVHDCRTSGSYRRLKEVLHRQLEASLPANAAECCAGVATVSVTQLFPRPRTRRISSFKSREELICALMASCHIPTYFNGDLTTSFRGKVTVDGGVTALMPTPTIPHDFLLKVCCFPRQHVARLPVFNRRRALHQLDLGITPDTFGPWPYTFRYMLAAALHPRSYRFIRVLLEAGCRDAARWAEAAGIASPEQLSRLTPLPLPQVLVLHPEQQPVDVGPGPGAGTDAVWAPGPGGDSAQFHAVAGVMSGCDGVAGAPQQGSSEEAGPEESVAAPHHHPPQ